MNVKYENLHYLIGISSDIIHIPIELACSVVIYIGPLISAQHIMS